MLERIETLARTRVDFGFETTLSGRGHLGLISRLRSVGYRVNLFFLCCPILISQWRGSMSACEPGGTQCRSL